MIVRTVYETDGKTAAALQWMAMMSPDTADEILAEAVARLLSQKHGKRCVEPDYGHGFLIKNTDRTDAERPCSTP